MTVIVQVDDLAATRARAEKLGIRSVWKIDLDDIAASHFHPKELGAITSADQPVDPASWRWGGPDWEEHRSLTKITGVEVGVPDPELWATLLDRPVDSGVMTLDDGSVIRFVDGAGGVVAVDVKSDTTGRETIIGGVTIRHV